MRGLTQADWGAEPDGPRIRFEAERDGSSYMPQPTAIAVALMLALLAAAGPAHAERPRFHVDHVARESLVAARPLDDRGVSLDEAVAMVQRRFDAKVVKAETVSQRGRRVHRIRLLSADGRVWTVSVDAETGEIR
jgi:uncharacterized membrane protein YkoI